MWKRLKTKIFYSSLGVIYLAGFCFFYYTYVPLVKPFQAALIPVLVTAMVTTVINVEWGMLFFVFALPLINNLPYFFGITLDIPHAPTALLLALAFFFGLLINKLFFNSKLNLRSPLTKPLFLFSIIVLISAIITLLRYANFFPFVSSGLYELVVNTNGVRAGGAFMSVIFAALNYLTGIGLFFVCASAVRGRSAIRKVLVVLSVAMTISLIFAIVQKHASIKLGNTPFWVFKDQTNSTFKDPNAFGTFLAAFFPLLLGMAFSFKKNLRLFSVVLIALTIYVYPWTGLRSGFLTILLSLVAFFVAMLLRGRMSARKKIAVAVSVGIIFIFVLALMFSGQAQSILSKRIAWSFGIVKGGITVDELFTQKPRLWKVAFSMIKDYPLTGVGVGAYIIELPNYSTLMGSSSRWTDSAENYFLQVGSELGLIGLFLMLWIFYEILKQMGWRSNSKDMAGDKPAGRDVDFIPLGISLGIMAIMVNYLFHSYIGSYEVIYLFWIFAALIFSLGKAREKEESKIKPNPKFRIAFLTLVFIFGGVHLWNSSHSLSLRNKTEKMGWRQDFGLYKEEKDDRQFPFRWARELAGTEMDILGPVLILPVLASHPDIEAWPVQVRFYLADENYRKQNLLQEINLKRKKWQEVEFNTSAFFGQKIRLVAETSRAWKPYRLGIPDARRLAVALGGEWFRYPEDLPKQKVESVQIIPASNWQAPDGQPSNFLYSNGRRQIRLRTEKPRVAFRLLLRGQQALGLGPFIVIKLDGVTMGKTMLNDESWRSIVLMPLSPDLSVGEHVLTVEFTNDLHKPELRQDRNVFLGDVEVIYLN